ncbi:MAG: ABC transporter permease [Lentisphaerae bacterium]|nr:ABC transporter permease [Lentisphaerota bacterium]
MSAANNNASGLFRDPLLLKELRTRMRARTVVAAGNLYVVALCAVVMAGLLVGGGIGEALGWEIGSTLFRTLVYTQAFLMLFVSPLVAASAVTGEVEQKTWDSLRAAPVTPGRVMGAKLAAAIACFLMLIVVSLPISSISFILGGVAPSDMLAAYVYTILCTGAAGAMGLYWSTRFERSIASIPAATITAVMVLILASPAQAAGLQALVMTCPSQFISAMTSDTAVPFFGLECPAWIPSFLFLCAMSVCLVTAAVVRITDASRRSHVLRRAMLLLFAALVMLFMVGEQFVAVTRDEMLKVPFSSAATRLLVLWLIAGLWVGASVPVTTSRTPKGAAALLTAPAGFMLLLFLVSLPAFGAGMAICGGGARAWAEMLAVLGGPVFLSTLAWTLLAQRLSGVTGRKTRRFIGLGIASFVSVALVVAPFVAISIITAASEDGVPAAVQYIALLSPLTPVWHGSGAASHTVHLKAVVAALGPGGPVFVTGGLYAAAAMALLVPAGWRKLRRGSAQ